MKLNNEASRLIAKIISRLFLILVILGTLTVKSEGSNQADKKAGKKIWLFNGSDTSHWRDIKTGAFPENGWKIGEGVLTVLAKTETYEGGHDIVTREQYANFELELEVRLSEGANSGVKYLVLDSFPNKAGQFLGLEYQLIDNDRHPDALLGVNGNRRMATLYDILPVPGQIKINPVGKWNKIKIVVDGNHVEHWLNNEKVLEFERNSARFKELVGQSKYNTLENFGSQKMGYLLLQGHGNEVSFRAISIRTW